MEKSGRRGDTSSIDPCSRALWLGDGGTEEKTGGEIGVLRFSLGATRIKNDHV